MPIKTRCDDHGRKRKSPSFLSCRLLARIGLESYLAVPVEVARYQYTDENNKVLYESVRFEPKDFRQRQPVNGHWNWSLKGVRLVLYRLKEVLDAERVIIVEGEKDVETLHDLGFTATTSAMGAKSWRREYAEFLVGKQVYSHSDNDEAGETYLDDIARSCIGKAKSVRVARLPEKYKDVSDWNPSRESIVWLDRASPLSGPISHQISGANYSIRSTNSRTRRRFRSR